MIFGLGLEVEVDCSKGESLFQGRRHHEQMHNDSKKPQVAQYYFGISTDVEMGPV